MRVLVLESDRHGADGAIRALERAGHEVVRCHDADAAAFPCSGLCGDATCPVEDRMGVDVALTMRSHAYQRPTPYEDGVTCALRRGVPLVVGGVTTLNPFETWTTVVATDERVVEACEEVVYGPNDRLGDPARVEIHRLLRTLASDVEDAEVVVHREGRRLLATIGLPADAPELDGQLAVAVAGVLRDRDPAATCIDVAVQRSA